MNVDSTAGAHIRRGTPLVRQITALAALLLCVTTAHAACVGDCFEDEFSTGTVSARVAR